MKVYVICCNGSAKYAVVDNHNKAITKKQELHEAFYEKNKGFFKDKTYYATQCKWHITIVNGE